MDPVVSYLQPDSDNLVALDSRCTVAAIEPISYNHLQWWVLTSIK